MLKNSKHTLSATEIETIQKYIRAHLHDPKLSVARIGKSIDQSEFHFARKFKQTTGLAPHTYVVRCRITRTQELLQHTNLKLAAIATEVGFADHSHLTRHFRRVTGITPSEYRKQLQKSK